MKITQTPWKTGALPAPEPNQVLLEKTYSGSHRIYGSFGSSGWWCLRELEYRYLKGGIPQNRSGSFNEWSIITYKPENRKPLVCPNCGSDNFDLLNYDDDVFFQNDLVYESTCNACKVQFEFTTEGEVEFTIGDIINKDLNDDLPF